MQVANKIALIGCLLHLNWINLVLLIIYGAGSAAGYFVLFTSSFVITQSLSILEIGVFSPPQWQLKMEQLNKITSSISGTSAVYDSSSIEKTAAKSDTSGVDV